MGRDIQWPGPIIEWIARQVRADRRALDIKHVRTHWDGILRLAVSAEQGTVTASSMPRKLGSYPRQNGLAVALSELGRIERSPFILDCLQNVELHRRIHAGLNNSEFCDNSC